MSKPIADIGLSRTDIDGALRQLSGHVLRTPVVRSEEIDHLAGARLWLKAENLQRGGSFKIRGALLAVKRLAAAGSRGVIAQSTGNHAIAVAEAARECGLPALLVLPTDAVPDKVQRVRTAGADVEQVGTTLAERSAAVDRLRSRHRYDVIDPYENRDVIAGQGTATAELISQVSSSGKTLDAVVLPVGGGSAVAGACLAAEGHNLAVIAAEPYAVPALTAALQADEPITVSTRQTVADGLRPDRIGQLSFAVARNAVRAVLTVQEDAISEALCVALHRAKLVIEPAAATALAAALRLANDSDTQFRDIGVLLSGGNFECALVASLLADYGERVR